MEFLFELTTVLANTIVDSQSGQIVSTDTALLQDVLREAKKGNKIRMFGAEIAFRQKKSGVNFKQSSFFFDIFNLFRLSFKT